MTGLMCSSGNTRRTSVNHAIETGAKSTAQWIWPKENSPEDRNIRFNDKSKKEKRNYSAPQMQADLSEIPKHLLKDLPDFEET